MPQRPKAYDTLLTVPFQGYQGRSLGYWQQTGQDHGSPSDARPPRDLRAIASGAPVASGEVEGSGSGAYPAAPRKCRALLTPQWPRAGLDKPHPGARNPTEIPGGDVPRLFSFGKSAAAKAPSQSRCWNRDGQSPCSASSHSPRCSRRCRGVNRDLPRREHGLHGLPRPHIDPL
jgi:hypothetical protein